MIISAPLSGGLGWASPGGGQDVLTAEGVAPDFGHGMVIDSPVEDGIGCADDERRRPAAVRQSTRRNVFRSMNPEKKRGWAAVNVLVIA